MLRQSVREVRAKLDAQVAQGVALASSTGSLSARCDALQTWNDFNGSLIRRLFANAEGLVEEYTAQDRAGRLVSLSEEDKVEEFSDDVRERIRVLRSIADRCALWESASADGRSSGSNPDSAHAPQGPTHTLVTTEVPMEGVRPANWPAIVHLVASRLGVSVDRVVTHRRGLMVTLKLPAGDVVGDALPATFVELARRAFRDVRSGREPLITRAPVEVEIGTRPPDRYAEMVRAATNRCGGVAEAVTALPAGVSFVLTVATHEDQRFLDVRAAVVRELHALLLAEIASVSNASRGPVRGQGSGGDQPERFAFEEDEDGEFVTSAVAVLEGAAELAEPPTVSGNMSAKVLAPPVPWARTPEVRDLQFTGRLGGGLYADVWCAVDPRLGRSVAVKIVRDSMAGESSALDHARALARAPHPNVVVVHDVVKVVDPAGGGRVVDAVIIELIQGETLQERLRRAVTRNDAARLGIGVLDGLHAIHEAGLVHMDLHEENVMVTRAGDAKIIDILYRGTLAVEATARREHHLRADVHAAMVMLGQLLDHAGVGLDGVAEFRAVARAALGVAAVRTAFIAAVHAGPAAKAAAPATEPSPDPVGSSVIVRYRAADDVAEVITGKVRSVEGSIWIIRPPGGADTPVDMVRSLGTPEPFTDESKAALRVVQWERQRHRVHDSVERCWGRFLAAYRSTN